MPVAVRPILALDYTMTAVGTTETVPYVVARPLVVIDCHNQCSATGAGSTSQLFRQALGSGGFNAVTAALVMATADALVRAVDLIAAQNIASVTDVLRTTFTSANGGTGRMWVHVTPTAIAGQ